MADTAKEQAHNAQLSPRDNMLKTRDEVGYIPLNQATPETYSALGYKSGLEIHQQLLTDQKLFCHCPAGRFQRGDDFDAEVIRHMRPTLSEMGEYDGTALMEKKTRKRIVYRIKDETACTYDIDDTPPFLVNDQALDRALEISHMLKLSIVGELHITRKQYLDGSIPTGFQRTGIIGVEGEIPVAGKRIGIMQLSLEEDSCREVSDIGHDRVYTTDRLGMPLIETVTYPELLTPWEIAEAAQYLRHLARSSGKVRTGIGAARQDVNVSVEGGTRIEIKGVQHIKWIPKLTHIEAFRQSSLLMIKDKLAKKIKAFDDWRPTAVKFDMSGQPSLPTLDGKEPDIYVVNLPGFGGILSHFTQPGKVFADEVSDRLKVIACLERPNLLHSEQFAPPLPHQIDWAKVRELTNAGPDDAQVLIWGPSDDIPTALETVEERCRLAFEGVPTETRKGLSNGTTIFERVLPGPDRMYPDTDTAPIPISPERIEAARAKIKTDIAADLERLVNWRIPKDCHWFIVRYGLVGVIDDLHEATGWDHRLLGLLFGHEVKHVARAGDTDVRAVVATAAELCKWTAGKKYPYSLAPELLKLSAAKQTDGFEALLSEIRGTLSDDDQITKRLGDLKADFKALKRSPNPPAMERWLAGKIKREVAPEYDLKHLKELVRKEAANV